MVYCSETYQLFPSAKAAAEHHGFKYQVIIDHLNGRAKAAKGKHFVYIENTADLSNFFASKRREEKDREAMRKAAEEKERELTEMQREIAKQLAAARKILRGV